MGWAKLNGTITGYGVFVGLLKKTLIDFRVHHIFKKINDPRDQ